MSANSNTAPSQGTPSMMSDDPSKAALLDLDQELVSKAALEKGRDAWSKMTWAERLGRVKEFEVEQEALVQRKPSGLPPTPRVAVPRIPSQASAAPSAQQSATPRPVSAAPTPAQIPLGKEMSRRSSRVSAAGSARSGAVLPVSPVQPATPAAPEPVTKVSSVPPSSHHTPTNHPSQVSRVSKVPSSVRPLSVAAETPLSEAPPPSKTRSRVGSLASTLSAKAASVAEQQPSTQALSRTMNVAAPTPPSEEIPDGSPAPTMPAHGSFTMCSSCDALRMKVRSLESTVKTLRKKGEHKADNSGLRDEVEDLRAQLDAAHQEIAQKDAENAHLSNMTEELRTQAQQSEAHIAELKDQISGFEDPELLYSQIWTLERALELRNEEIAHLHSVMSDFMVKIAELDERLAVALRKLLTQAKEDAEEKEKEVFGITAADAVEITKKKRKAAKGGRRKSTQSAVSQAARADLETLRNENEALKRRMNNIQRSSMHDISTVRQLSEKDQQIAFLQDQLQKAQDAILSGVEKGQDMRREAETKLKETRHVLRNLLGQAKPGASPAQAQAAQQEGQLANPPSVVVVQNVSADAINPPQLTERDLIDPPDMPVWSHRPNNNDPPTLGTLGLPAASPAPLSPREVQAYIDTRLQHVNRPISPPTAACRTISPLRTPRAA